MNDDDKKRLESSALDDWWGIFLDSSHEERLADVIGEGEVDAAHSALAELRTRNKGGSGHGWVQFVKSRHLLRAGELGIPFVLNTTLGPRRSVGSLDSANDDHWEKIFWTPE